MSCLTGFSHLTITAPTIELYTRCRDFYNGLGFVTVKQNEVAKHTLLHLFGEQGEKDITIKLIHNEHAHLKERPVEGDWRLQPVCFTVITGDIEEIKSQLTSLSVAFKSYSTTAKTSTMLSVPSLSDPVPSPLSSPFMYPDNVSQLDVYAHDPLNNLICFTNKMSPFSRRVLLPPSVMETRVEREPVHKAQTGHKVSKSEIGVGLEEALNEGRVRKRIGILTSGGDSPGMNAAVRAIVRVAIAKGCEAYAIFEGYKGLVLGDDMIKQFRWADVRGYLAIGGTLIGTARCEEFRTREGRLRAAHNLVKKGIDALIVVGGDGSLTGANILRSEWTGLLEELVSEGRLSIDETEPYTHLTIVGLVGSIDNDMSSTDITIGAATSLHRICEALDSISSTAASHSRAFVIEVMGRHCGWLALMAAISVGADYVFLPERPPIGDDWEEQFCDILRKNRGVRERGKRKTIIIVAEGAIDQNLKPIKADYVKEILTTKMGLDTRVTCLGHTQRGGRPCAFDRNLATRQGVEAVDAVLSASPETQPSMIGLRENAVTRLPLMEAVELNRQIVTAIKEKDFRAAMELRDPEFGEDFVVYASINTNYSDDLTFSEDQRLRIGIIHIGAPAGGMNTATRAAVRYALNSGHIPVAIHNGFPGLLKDNVHEFTWLGTEDWASKGGSELGTNRTLPDIDLGMVAYKMQQHSIKALLIIGGFEAYRSLIILNSERPRYPAFRIPMVCLPATISNNVPGTDFSLGSDTALNAIVDSCDALKQSATASRRRVFVVEVQGGTCGYLAVLSGLAVGATSCYIPEEGISLKKLQDDVNHFIRRFGDDDKGVSSGRLILRNESLSDTYTTDVIANIIKTEGQGLFDCRTCILGHIQQGSTPSPLDRIRATRLAVKCVNFLEKHVTSNLTSQEEKDDLLKKNAVVIGISGAHVVFTPVIKLQHETDLVKRKSTKAWWLGLKDTVALLSKWGYAPIDIQESLRSPDRQH